MIIACVSGLVPVGSCQESAEKDSILSMKIHELEQRIGELEQRQMQAGQSELQRSQAQKDNDSALKELLRDAKSLDRAAPEEAPPLVFYGSERHQPQLNPEISMTGDFFGSYSNSDDSHITEPGDFTDGRNRFDLRGAELNVVAPLDPFTRGKFFLSIPGSGSVSLSEMIDEAYMEWLNLPARLNIKVGKFYSQFGILNRWHDHGLPQVDRPSALNNLFIGESLSGLGLSGNFLLGNLWADANELTVEVFTGGDGQSFDKRSNTVVGVAHLKNYYDLTRNTYMEFGFSGAHGYNDHPHKHFTTLGGADLTLKWVPADRSHYRTIEFRNEFFISHHEGPAKDLDRYGFYSSLKSKLGPRFWYGLRYSYSELPIPVSAPSARDYEWDITPAIDFWQSEFVMMRLQYSYTKRNYMENDHSIFLQSVWSMGPHKHEAY
jgi:hypothetical protein